MIRFEFDQVSSLRLQTENGSKTKDLSIFCVGAPRSCRIPLRSLQAERADTAVCRSSRSGVAYPAAPLQSALSSNRAKTELKAVISRLHQHRFWQSNSHFSAFFQDLQEFHNSASLETRTSRNFDLFYFKLLWLCWTFSFFNMLKLFEHFIQFSVKNFLAWFCQ